MKNIQHLKNQGTLSLVILTPLTLGIYLARYISRQTGLINTGRSLNRQISSTMVAALLGFTYISAMLTILMWIVMYVIFLNADALDPILTLVFSANDLTHYMAYTLTLIWSFLFRDRLHEDLNSPPDSDLWFDASWTFLFGPMYLNYKINKIFSQSEITRPNKTMEDNDLSCA